MLTSGRRAKIYRRRLPMKPDARVPIETGNGVDGLAGKKEGYLPFRMSANSWKKIARARVKRKGLHEQIVRSELERDYGLYSQGTNYWHWNRRFRFNLSLAGYPGLK